MKKAKAFYVLYSNYGAFTPKMYTSLSFTSQIKSPNNPVLEYKVFQQKQQAVEFLALRKEELEKPNEKQPKVKKEKKEKSNEKQPKVKKEKKEKPNEKPNEKQPTVKKEKEKQKVLKSVSEENNEKESFVGQKKEESQPRHQATRIFFDNFIRLPFQVRNNYTLMNLFQPGKLVLEVDPKKTYRGEFDGCCKGNPGLGGVGYLIKLEQKLVLSNAIALGNCTNNISQFTAMLLLLTDAHCNNIRRIRVSGDSNLAIKAMNGAYHLTNFKLVRIYQQSKIIASLFQQIQFTHVRRLFNHQADALANKGVKLKKYFPKPMPQNIESLWKNDTFSTQ